jgi:hypothetical protein
VLDDKNPRVAAKKIRTEAYDQPEGLTLDTKKRPKGTDENTNPNSGVLRKKLGSAMIVMANSSTMRTELKILIDNIELGISEVVNKLIVQ